MNKYLSILVASAAMMLTVVPVHAGQQRNATIVALKSTGVTTQVNIGDRNHVCNNGARNFIFNATGTKKTLLALLMMAQAANKKVHIDYLDSLNADGSCTMFAVEIVQ